MINPDDLGALETILIKNSALQEKLRTSKDVETASRFIGEIAALNNIPFDAAEYEAFLRSIQSLSEHQALSDVELQQIAAGRPHAPTGEMRYLTEDEQRWYGFVYGTGAGAAVLTVNSEQRKDGGAKEFADAVFHGGKTNLAGLV
jgi:hypothetical protein